MFHRGVVVNMLPGVEVLWTSNTRKYSLGPSAVTLPFQNYERTQLVITLGFGIHFSRRECMVRMYSGRDS